MCAPSPGARLTLDPSTLDRTGARGSLCPPPRPLQLLAPGGSRPGGGPRRSGRRDGDGGPRPHRPRRHVRGSPFQPGLPARRDPADPRRGTGVGRGLPRGPARQGRPGLVQPLPPRHRDAPRRAGAVPAAGTASPHQLRGDCPPLRGPRRPVRLPEGRGALARRARARRGGVGRRPAVAGGLRRRLRRRGFEPPGTGRHRPQPDPPRGRREARRSGGGHQQRPLRRALRRGHARRARLHPTHRRPLTGERPPDQSRVLAEARRRDGPPAPRGGGRRRRGRRGGLHLRAALR